MVQSLVQGAARGEGRAGAREGRVGGWEAHNGGIEGVGSVAAAGRGCNWALIWGSIATVSGVEPVRRDACCIGPLFRARCRTRPRGTPSPATRPTPIPKYGPYVWSHPDGTGSTPPARAPAGDPGRKPSKPPFSAPSSGSAP